MPWPRSPWPAWPSACASRTGVLYKESLLRQAAEGGNAEAQFALGMYFYRDDKATTAEQARRSEEVISLWQAAAAQGHGPAQASLAAIYQESDPVQALHWLRAAAKQGEISAQLGLAQRLAKGRGLEPDPAAAIGWYRKAAAAPEGRTARRRAAGRIFTPITTRGSGPMPGRPFRSPARNSPTCCWKVGAPKPIPQAALQGFTGQRRKPGWGEAAVRLAELFRNGRGVPRNLAQSERWLRVAVEVGHLQAAPRPAGAAGRAGPEPGGRARRARWLTGRPLKQAPETRPGVKARVTCQGSARSLPYTCRN